MFNGDDDDVVEHLPVDIDKYVNAIELVTQIKHPHNCMIVIIIDDFVFLETEFKKRKNKIVNKWLRLLNIWIMGASSMKCRILILFYFKLVG